MSTTCRSWRICSASSTVGYGCPIYVWSSRKTLPTGVHACRAESLAPTSKCGSPHGQHHDAGIPVAPVSPKVNRSARVHRLRAIQAHIRMHPRQPALGLVQLPDQWSLPGPTPGAHTNSRTGETAFMAPKNHKKQIGHHGHITSKHRGSRNGSIRHRFPQRAPPDLTCAQGGHSGAHCVIRSKE